MSCTKTLKAPVSQTLEIKKSRFIGCIEPVHSHEEGLARVAALWREHPDARHICYSMLVQGQVRQSDDGEPSGTAARPILNVLQHNQLDNTLATVVRYFGGIKLGAGGLVRAYTQAISEPLAKAEFTEIKVHASTQIGLDYEHEAKLRHLAEQSGIALGVDYQHRVLATLTGEQAQIDSLIETLRNQLRGDLRVLDETQTS